MAKESAGILLYRERSKQIEVLLVHFGGPFWVRKDRGAWSIPKGELDSGQDPLTAAKRELHEETGISAAGDLIPLDPVRQAGGKVVHAGAMNGDVDAATTSNTFVIEWPRGSGSQQEFPEIDRAGWFTLDVAAEKIVKSQAGFIAQLRARLDSRRSPQL